MKQNKYQSYKPSGVEWIGDIPENWKVIRVKHLVDKSKYYQIGDGDHGSIKPEMYVEKGIPYIRVQNLNWDGEIDLNGLVYITNEVHNKNLKSRIVIGDILIAKTGATIGKLGFVKSNVGESNTTSSVGKVSIDKNKYIPEFYLYNFQTNYFQKKIWITGSQKSAQPGFNIDDLVDFEVIYPPLQEQEQIVKYLDEKTTIINKLISSKYRKVELLKEQRNTLINQVITKGLNPNVKMKDSGVEWIGEIPESWVIKKMKYLVKICNGSDFKNFTLEEGGYPVYGSGGVFSRSSEFIYDKISVLLGRKGSVDKPKIVNEPFWCSDTTYFTKIKENVNPYYFFFLVQQIKFDLYIYGSAIPSMTKSVYDEMLFPYPNIQEQEEIVEYLDKHTKEIDDLVSMEQKKIELLKEYRQSIISEVITGKIKVN